MYIAKQKRRENIAEYILYLWQLEDLLRALEFSESRIYDTLVAPYPNLDDAGRQGLYNWYIEMANLLKIEGHTASGYRSHLEHTMHLIAELQDLHFHLLDAPAGKSYKQTFAPLSGELPKLRTELVVSNSGMQGTGSGAGDALEQVSDIELCFMALYSVFLCRLKGEGQSQYVNDVLELISPVIAELAAIHRGAERGEIDLYKEEG